MASDRARRGRRTRVLAVSLACALAPATVLAGCASTVDPKSGENLIRQLVSRTPSLGTLKTVRCPSGLSPKVGTAFDCKLTVQSGGRSTTGTITVHIIQGHKVAISGASDLSPSLTRLLAGTATPTQPAG